MVRTARNKLKAHGMDLNDMVMDRSWDANLRTAHDEEQPLMRNGGDVETPGTGYSARMLYKQPAETLKWLEQYGTKKLGDFKVRDNTVHQLLDRDGMLTVGTDAKDIDWEAMWRDELDHDDRDPAEDERTAAMEVEAYVVDIQNAADADVDGLINPLLHCYQNCVFNVNVWALPAVQATITFKWNSWAKRCLLVELCLYLTWLIAFQVFVLLFQDEDTTLSLEQLVMEPHGIATVAFEIISTLGMLPFIYIEICTMIEYSLWGWLDFWNVMDVSAYALQIVIVIMHLSRAGVDSNELSVIMAIQVLVLWIKVQYYARVLQPTKNPFVDTLKAVLKDVKWFLFLLLVTMFGFSVAFNILYRRDQEKETVMQLHRVLAMWVLSASSLGQKQFRTIGSSFTTCFDWLMGGVDFTIFQGTHNPQVGIILLLLYWFSMSMVLLNCLIAIMADACTRVSENQAARFMAGRAEIIDELEGSLPGWLRKRTMGACYPKYIHFLKVNRNSADPSMSSAAAKEDEAAGRMDDLEAQIKRIGAIQEALAKQLLDKKTYEGLPPLVLSEDD